MSDKQFLQSAAKFTKTYNVLSKKSSNAHLMSAFYNFGWCFGGMITSQQGGILRRGKKPEGYLSRLNLQEEGRQQPEEKDAVIVGCAPKCVTGEVIYKKKYTLPVRRHIHSQRTSLKGSRTNCFNYCISPIKLRLQMYSS